MTERDGKPKMGRPVKPVPPELSERYLDHIASGGSVEEFAREVGLNKGTLYSWCWKDEDFAKRFAQARQVGAEALIDQAREIADQSADDVVIDENGKPRVVQEVVQRSKLRVETRLKIAACFRPQQFGLRVQHGGDPSAPPIKVENTHPAPELPRGDALKTYLADFFAAARAQGMIADATTSQDPD